MSQLDWEDIRHFTALAQTTNLARAAAELGTSQVTVMRRVRSLEAALRATLFLRHRSGHRLTHSGIEFLKATREASEVIKDGAARISGRDASPEGRVRITTTEICANWILLPRIAAFKVGNPGISLHIDASPRPMVLTDDLDTLALRFRRPDTGPFRIRKMGDVRFGLYRRLGLGALPLGPYIGWTSEFEDIALSRWLRALHHGSDATVSLTTFAGHLDAAKFGVGAAALPDFIGSNEPLLERVQTPGGDFTLEAWLVVPKHIAGAARVRKTCQFIETAFSDIRKEP